MKNTFRTSALVVFTLVLLLTVFTGCRRVVRPETDRTAQGVVYVQNISVGNHTNYNNKGSNKSSNKSSSKKTANSSFSPSANKGGTVVVMNNNDNTSSSDSSGDNEDSSQNKGGGVGAAGIICPLVFVAIIVIAIAMWRSKRKKKVEPGVTYDPPSNTLTQDEIIGMIREHDPNFDSEKFLSWSKQVFVQLQEAWQERNWKKARPFESEELFNLHKSQLDEFLKNHTINMMENVCVNEAYLYDYKAEGTYEYLTVFMQTSYNDYIISEETKQVVKGDPDTRYDTDYKARFMRSVGVQTGGNSNASTTKCPNCGAPVDVNAAGQCAYCDTVITNGQHDWVLCNLDDVR